MRLTPAIFLLCVGTVLAADHTLSCPASIPVKQNPGEMPDRWEGLDRSRTGQYSLIAAGFTYGHPKNNSDLKPDNADSRAVKGRPRVLKYIFDGSFQEGIFLDCRFSDTSVTAFTRLPAGIKTCEITYSAKPDAPSPIQSIKCR